MSPPGRSYKWMREVQGDGVDKVVLGEKIIALWHIDWKWPILSKCLE